MVRPTFVAETQKHSEKLLRQTQVEIIKRKIEQAATIKVSRKQAIKSKWKAIAKFALFSKGGYQGFSYPAENFMNSRIFCELFPFHFIFDKDLNLRQAGVGIQTYLQDLKKCGISINGFFKLVHPPNTDFNWDNSLKFIQTPHIFRCERSKMFNWGDKPDLFIR